MDGLSFRQGTIYKEKESGSIIVLIHHNPMALQSLAAMPQGMGKWSFARISIDDIIAMRQSGKYEETGDMTPEQLCPVLDQLLNGKLLSDEEQKLVSSIRDSIR